MKKTFQTIIAGLAISAICTGAWAVTEVKILKVTYMEINSKLNRVLCLLGEKSNCKD